MLYTFYFCFSMGRDNNFYSMKKWSKIILKCKVVQFGSFKFKTLISNRIFKVTLIEMNRIFNFALAYLRSMKQSSIVREKCWCMLVSERAHIRHRDKSYITANLALKNRSNRVGALTKTNPGIGKLWHTLHDAWRFSILRHFRHVDALLR